MKKMMSLMLGLGLLAGATTFAFAQTDSTKKSATKKTSTKKTSTKKSSTATPPAK